MPIIQRIEVRCDLMGFWLYFFMEKFASILDGRYLLSSNCYIIPQQGKRKFKKLYGTKDTSGYIIFGLQVSKSVQKKFKSHRLLAEYFIPNPENKLYVNHINGNPSDNRLENLEWCTFRENIIHSNSVLKRGNTVILNKDIVEEIRNLYNCGVKIKDIHKSYPLVRYTTIYNAASGRSWNSEKESTYKGGRRGNIPPIVCFIDGCSRYHYARSLCKKHYQYNKKHKLCPFD